MFDVYDPFSNILCSIRNKPNSSNTLIAFCSDKGFFVRQNDWSTTTGKHLNWINTDKKERLTSEQFKAKYKESFGKELND